MTPEQRNDIMRVLLEVVEYWHDSQDCKDRDTITGMITNAIRDLKFVLNSEIDESEDAQEP